MRKISFLTVLLLLVGYSSFAFSAEERIYYARHLSKEPILDGKTKNEPAWENIPASTGFINLGKGALASKQTFFKIGYTEEALYIAIECEEPEVKKIKAELKDMGNLWTEDSIELFIFPEGADNYYQFVVNAIASRYNGKGCGGAMPLWDWQVKTYQGEDYWSMEVMIPFEIFYILPEKGEEWRINICRNDASFMLFNDRQTSWAQKKSRAHEPDNFGKIVFKDEI